ncbi:MAG: mechanosensitive ion channel, partial [bacterium]
FNSVRDFIVNNGPQIIVNLIVFLVILLIGKIIISIITKTLSMMLSKNERMTEIIKRFVLNLVNKAFWVVVLMIALPKLGINVAPLIAGVGVAGFIIGFAFQESLSNLAAGFMLLLNQPFRIGHYVRAGGESGTVEEMDIMSTKLITPDNKAITLPNKSVWGSSITNYTIKDRRRVEVSVGISYSADIMKARSVITDLISSHESILKEDGITVEVGKLADSSVNLVVRMWTKTEDYWDVFFEMNRRVKEELDNNNIEIPFPQMDVHLDKLA